MRTTVLLAVLLTATPLLLVRSANLRKGPPVYVSTTLHQWPSEWPPMKVHKGSLGHLSLAYQELSLEQLVNEADLPKSKEKRKDQ